MTNGDEAAAAQEEQPVKKKSQKKTVSPNALGVEVWVNAAYEATGYPPEVVRAALSLAGSGPYNREQVILEINKFMQRPVKQEG